MIHDIFINTSILVSFLLVIGQLFKNYSFGTRQTLKAQSLLGMVFGILGIVLMVFTIKMTETVIIDLRNISIICAAILGGPVAAIISAIIIAVFRLMYFGVSTTSIVAHLAALLVGTGAAYVSIMKISRRHKFAYVFIFSMVVSNAALFYLIRDTEKLLETLSYYWPVYLFGALLAYLASEYIMSANSNFRSMQYYRMTADNLSDMITTHEIGGKIKFVSPPVYTLFGYTVEEFVGTNAYQYIHPEDIASIKEAFASVMFTNGESTQTLRTRKKDGSYIWVEVSVRIIKNSDGSVREMVCVTRDISKRKEIENELVLSNAKFKAIFENAGIGIVVQDKNETLIDVNPAYLEMVGCSKEEAQQLVELIHPDDYREVSETFDKLLNNKYRTYRAEIRYITKAKETIYADVTSTLINGTEHTPISIIRIISNITERKKMEKKLRESEERFKAAFDNAVTGMCLANLNGRFLNPNQAFCDIFGYSSEELLQMDFTQITYPDDLEEDLSNMKRLLSGEISKIVLEKRYFHKNGNIIWALLGVSAVYDDRHKPLYLVGQVQDITLRKSAEAEIKHAKDKAERLAYIDHLTSVLNRRAFEDRFREEFNRVGRENSSISIILADIDNFKRINDNYGHQVGDIALQKFAKCLSNTCRPYDFIGRHGGEEFIICLPNTNYEHAIMIAERMRKAIEDLVINSEDAKEPIRLTASFGVSSPILGVEEDIKSLILSADKAMYKAKFKGRNRVCGT